MTKIKTTVNFKRLLEDISYTNKVMKMFDVSDIITRNQYYELKDSLVLWMLKHTFTENKLDGLEYTTGKYGDRVELIKLTIKYGDTECLLHQNLDKKTRELFNLHDTKEEDFEQYVPAEYDGVEFDENTFRESISRMKVTRMKFLREGMVNNEFWHMYALNVKSKNPWMKVYRFFLPLNGTTGIRIVAEDDDE